MKPAITFSVIAAAGALHSLWQQVNWHIAPTPPLPYMLHSFQINLCEPRSCVIVNQIGFPS